MKLLSSLSEMSRAARIGAVVSISWLIIVFVVVLEEASTDYRFDWGDFFGPLLIFGVLPVIVGWGVRWIRKA